MELFSDAEFWVGIGFIAVIGIIVWQKVPAMVGKSLDERAAAISAELDTAKRLRIEAEALLAQYRKKAADVDKEAQAILTAAKAEADVFPTEARAPLKLQIERRGAAAQQKIAQAEATAISEIRAAAADAAVAAA